MPTAVVVWVGGTVLSSHSKQDSIKIGIDTQVSYSLEGHNYFGKTLATNLDLFVECRCILKYYNNPNNKTGSLATITIGF